MKYTVTWVGTADRALTNIWLAASDQNAVTLAARAIDSALQFNPAEVGESREFGLRIAIALPLAVLFSVHPPDMLVKVLRVWRIRRRRK
jgi:hypothetical protein